jgi:hypothetical protein
MDMSPAALPPIQPPILDKDRQHPLFSTYMATRSWFASKLLQAPAFQDWLYQRERDAREREQMQHPRFKEFQDWMQDNKGGRRKCPAGNTFPHNFFFWLDGGRW